MSTTCRNNNCPNIERCDHNIHRDGMRPRDQCPEGFSYMSQRQAIYREYRERCEVEEVDPLPYNIYFEL